MMQNRPSATTVSGLSRPAFIGCVTLLACCIFIGTGSQKAEASEKAPNFTVLNWDQKSVSLPTDGKPVLVNFWASWCPPCKMEMPHFNEAFKKYGDKVTFMMINHTDGQRETIAQVRKYITSKKFSFPVYFDTTLEASSAYGLEALPTTVFIAADGTIFDSVEGMLDKDDLEDILNELLKK